MKDLQHQQHQQGPLGETEKDPNLLDSKDEENRHLLSSSLAEAETRVVSYLRLAALLVLVITAVVVCTGVHYYASNNEQEAFLAEYENSALQVMDHFHDSVERNLAAVASLSTDITSYAQRENLTFPFVTMPDFALKGAHLRILSGAFIIQYRPLVMPEKREEWEIFTQQNRGQIDQAFEQDKRFRDWQVKNLRTEHRDNWKQMPKQPHQIKMPLTLPFWTMGRVSTHLFGFHNLLEMHLRVRDHGCQLGSAGKSSFSCY
jgi:hypothetical protein